MSGRVVVFGDVIDDLVVVPSGVIRPDTDTPSTIHSAPGGSAANAAAWLGSLGVPVDFVGRVGRGDATRHAGLLAENGVTPHLSEDPTLSTGAIVVLVEGERRAMLTDRGANSALHPDQVTDALLEGAALLHLTGYSVVHSPDPQALDRLIARARRAGVLVSVDPASAGDIADHGAGRFLRTIAGADLIFPNRDEAAVLAGAAGGDAASGADRSGAAQVHAHSADGARAVGSVGAGGDADVAAERLSRLFALVVVTLGSGGVLVARRGRPLNRLPADATEIVDPTGAGDAFCAGFLAEWLRTSDDLAAARAGSALGARCAGIRGGRPA